jgi:stage III sporulation protein AG
MWQNPKKRTQLIFVLGAVGILLILFSEFLPNKSDTAADDESGVSGISFDETQAYKESVETQLAEIISQIKGAGTVNVMVTISGTREYVYAEQSDTSRVSGQDEQSEQQKSEIVLAEDGSDEQPIVKKIIAPEICGAVVVCEGAANPQTKENILNAVTSVLGLSSSRVSVVPSE